MSSVLPSGRFPLLVSVGLKIWRTASVPKITKIVEELPIMIIQKISELNFGIHIFKS